MQTLNYVQSFGKAGKSTLLVVVQGCTRCGATEGELADEKTAGLSLNVGTDTWSRTIVTAIPVCTDCLNELLQEVKDQNAN